jgi:hypothetical protein
MTQSSKTAEAISARATGVLFFAGFGSLWLYHGVSAMHALNFVTSAAVGTIFAALAVPAAMLLKSTSKARQAKATSRESMELRRALLRVNAMQWAAIVAAVVLFNILHKQEFLAAVITFIVGMHLFPLAELFRYPAHKVTGTLLVLWAIAMVTLFPGQMMPSVGNLGTAVILLGSAAYTLASATRVAKLKHVAGRLSHARV